MEIFAGLTYMNRSPLLIIRVYYLKTLAIFALLATLMSFARPARAQELSVQVDPAQSKVEYSLDSTMHTVHGTFYIKNGAVHYDPASGQIGGTIVVDATSGQSGNNSRD